ncbi:hypothetical protein JTB14_016313 [Gonioctena quinquepunctata]|nr:hypothetical protein JTB14_016313 [Gonioctena quinquepunctata]
MRVNTFSLDFTELPQRINAYEVHEFIDSKLKLQDDQLLSIAIQGNKVYIKVVTQEIVDNILAVYDGKEYKVIINNEIRTYGILDESITNDMWKNLRFKCYNDTKLTRMEMRRPIPSYIIIAGVKYWITYPGQRRTCRKCNSTEHGVKDCDQVLSYRLKRNEYAAAVRNNEPRRPVNMASNEEVDSDSETCEKSGRNEVDSEEDPLSMSFSSETPRPNQEDEKNRKRRNHWKNSHISTSELERALETPAKKFLIGVNWNELMDADQGPPREDNLSQYTEQGI